MAMLDLHTHSTASDGTLSPTELVDAALARGLTGLALTDHDTLSGIEAACAHAGPRGLRFLAGIELSAAWQGEDSVHLLGYGVDGPQNADLRAACSAWRAARLDRSTEMVARLQRAGVPITHAAVLAQAGTGAVGRPHVARALVAAGGAGGLQEAFSRWLVPGTPGYVPHARLEAAAAVATIRAAGGVAVLAHPGRLALDTKAREALVTALCTEGLGGIEAYWAQHDAATVAWCELMAARHRLLATGGSDFHGDNKPGVELGMLAGGVTLRLELMDALGTRAAAKD